MNKAILKGRLTKDPEARTTQGGVNVCTFTLAVDRPHRDGNGNKVTDFLPCVAWRQTADFVAQYIHKGNQLLIEGSIQTRSYDAQDGSKRHVTEIVVDRAEFCETRQESPAPVGAPRTAPQQFAEASEDDQDHLPF